MSKKTAVLLLILIALCTATFCWEPISKAFKDYAITGQITQASTLTSAIEENNCYVIETNGKAYNCYFGKDDLNSVSEAARPYLGDRIEVTLSRNNVKKFESWTKNANGTTICTKQKCFKITSYKILTPFLGIRYNSLVKVHGNILDIYAEVIKVIPGSPADKAGLKIGDLILKTLVQHFSERGAEFTLDNIRDNCKPGDEVSLMILRGEKDMIIKVTLGDRNQV